MWLDNLSTNWKILWCYKKVPKQEMNIPRDVHLAYIHMYIESLTHLYVYSVTFISTVITTAQIQEPRLDCALGAFSHHSLHALL